MKLRYKIVNTNIADLYVEFPDGRLEKLDGVLAEVLPDYSSNGMANNLVRLDVCGVAEERAFPDMSSIGRGTQVIRVPDWGDPSIFGYPHGAEPGFITLVTGRGNCFVRFWSIKDGQATSELRTKFCSELTPIENLIVRDTVDQKWVEMALDLYCK